VAGKSRGTFPQTARDAQACRSRKAQRTKRTQGGTSFGFCFPRKSTQRTKPCPDTLTRAMIKTVIFDLGKVIVPFDFTRGYRAMEGLCAYSAEEIPRRLSSNDLVQQFESGKVEPEEFVEQLCRMLDMRMVYAH